ncbi:DoxX family protein [Puniceibacterium sp. IMCC21224]|uniref:DoxX family protein n=1 Tax=Puniceibacterium sp. IMCC21224 TaxID=1618204 RepID=UPI00064D9720|nr:DoxX family protein [Puniceibacterium sp. IMCC21224]KMK67908.1 hypothetical protein IMCC21224_112785 [Puniceibacterium sp. IMCC21224]
MDRLISLHNSIFDEVEKADGLLPLLSRLVFAATLLGYFWASGLTKLGAGPVGFLKPSLNAYAQIFPRQMEAVGYDASQLGVFHWAVVVAGTWAEFLLPLLILVGLFTRLASLGMIGFILVQSLTDLYGHGAINQPETLGAWFDRIADSPIMDLRAFWIFLLLVLVIKGAGALSLDRILRRQILGRPAPA